MEARLADATVSETQPSITRGRRVILAWTAAAAIVLIGLVLYTGVTLSKRIGDEKTRPIGNVLVSSIERGEIQCDGKLLGPGESITLNKTLSSNEGTIGHVILYRRMDPAPDYTDEKL